MMSGLPLEQVRTLLAAVDEGTFEAAAERLHVTPSAVSQRVKALEQRVGRVLLLRTKPVRLTASGETVVRFGRQLALLERDAAAELGLAGAVGPVTLPVAVNSDSLATWFLPALADPALSDGAPAVCFDLHRDDQDHTALLLRQGRVMAAVTSSPEPVQGCSVTPLGRMGYRAYAAPAFAARHLAGGPLAELLPAAPMVVFDRKDGLQDAFLRALRPGLPTSGQPRTYVPASESFVAAVAAGLGWGAVPDVQAAPYVRAGTLRCLDPRRVVDVALYWQQWKLDSPPLAALTAAVTRAAAAALEQGAAAQSTSSGEVKSGLE